MSEKQQLFLKKSFSVTLLFFLFCTFFSLHAQDKARITVLPFQPIEVSASIAMIISTLFETNLVNTLAYSVLSQNERDQVLAAQEVSISDCTDEACAVDIGKLLAAEHIIMGTVAALGTKYIINAKVVDVTTSKTIGADSISASSVEELDIACQQLTLSLVEKAVPGFKVAEAEPETGIEVVEEQPEEGIKPKEAKTTTEITAEKSHLQEKNYFSTVVGFGLTIPLGEVGQIMNIGWTPIGTFNYNFALNWGIIGIGFLLGSNIQSTKTDVSYQYDMLSFPIAVNLKYCTNFDFPLFGFFEISSGIAVNVLLYREDSQKSNNGTAGKFFLAPRIGGGYYFIPGFAVSIHFNLMMIFFDKSTYIGISPALRVELNF